MNTTPPRTDLVLVGGGHTHVQVLRRWMMRPIEEVRLTLVVDRPDALYSGMVPGFVAGDYAVSELEIDVVPLARRAGARIILSAATRIDPAAKEIALSDRPPIRYDVASLDVGSTVRDLDTPGVREHALATRPIRAFVDALEAGIDAARLRRGSEPLRVVIVGAGAAGAELAFTLRTRIAARGVAPEIALISADEQPLPGDGPRVVARLVREATARGVRIHTGARVSRVEKDAVLLEGGKHIPADLTVWATGAAALPLLRESPLSCDAAGFVRVGQTLQSVDSADLFAAGDCASIADAPWVRKAGVYAVRAGPYLDTNLRARLTGGRLRSFRPQRDFMALLHLGDGRALGAKWGVPLVGRSLLVLKDRIDRRFMRRFQVLSEDGALAADFPDPDSMGMEEMPCGGCAAKLGASALEAALTRLPAPPADPRVVLGLDRPDDAAAFAVPGGDVVLATVDAFRAFTDDPYLVGRVAAVNAVSDVLAKGGQPRHALALVNVPEDDPGRAGESLYQVLSGVRAALDPLGVSLIGGHTTQGGELYVGLTVTGDAPVGGAITNDGLRVGDALVLTKPLGTGVVLAADMQGRAPGVWLRAALESMQRDNARTIEIARQFDTLACTDISGFGLAGHLGEMLRGARLSATISLAALPALPGAAILLERGLRSTYHDQNAAGRRGLAFREGTAGDVRAELLFDPQTSGGLLFGVAVERAEAAVEELRAAGERAAVIGTVEPLRADGALFEVAR